MSYQDISQELRELFRYEPDTGKVFYKKRYFGWNLSPRQKQWNSRFTGLEVWGWINNGYIRISLFGKNYYLHQIIFAIMEGYIPEEVDHEDKNKLNNKWNNLRDADRMKNAANVFKRRNNKSGLKGVSWSKSNNCWRMDIQYNKLKYYSYHATEQEAYQAYCDKSAKLHMEFGCVE